MRAIRDVLSEALLSVKSNKSPNTGICKWRQVCVWRGGGVTCLQGVGESHNVHVVAFLPHGLHAALPESLHAHLVVAHALQGVTSDFNKYKLLTASCIFPISSFRGLPHYSFYFEWEKKFVIS